MKNRFTLIAVAILLILASVAAYAITHKYLDMTRRTQGTTTFTLVVASTGRDTSAVIDLRDFLPIMATNDSTYGRVMGVGIVLTRLEIDTGSIVGRVQQGMFKDSVGTNNWILTDTLHVTPAVAAGEVEYLFPQLHAGLPFMRVVWSRAQASAGSVVCTFVAKLFYRARQ